MNMSLVTWVAQKERLGYDLPWSVMTLGPYNHITCLSGISFMPVVGTGDTHKLQWFCLASPGTPYPWLRETIAAQPGESSKSLRHAIGRSTPNLISCCS